VHEHSDVAEAMIEDVEPIEEAGGEDEDAIDDEDMLGSIATACESADLDVDELAIGVTVGSVLVLKPVEATNSTVVELDIIDVTRVVTVAVGTRHSTIPDC
jgi:hypothetical protein